MSSSDKTQKKFNFKELIKDALKASRPYTYKIKGGKKIEDKEEPNKENN
jgi:hypothetical protein